MESEIKLQVEIPASLYKELLLLSAEESIPVDEILNRAIKKLLRKE